MKLEQQVCSLDLAKRLKDLGAGQESYFWYGENMDGWILDHLKLSAKIDGQTIAAFTVAELGEMIPRWVHTAKWIEADLCRWGVFVDKAPEDYTEPKEIMSENTEADARAKMLIYLLENKLAPIPA